MADFLFYYLRDFGNKLNSQTHQESGIKKLRYRSAVNSLMPSIVKSKIVERGH